MESAWCPRRGLGLGPASITPPRDGAPRARGPRRRDDNKDCADNEKLPLDSGGSSTWAVMASATGACASEAKHSQRPTAPP